MKTSALTWALVAASVSASPFMMEKREKEPSAEDMMNAFAAGNMSKFLGSKDASMYTIDAHIECSD